MGECPFLINGICKYDMNNEASDLNYYKRLAEAGDKTILEMMSLWNHDIDFEMGYNYKKHQSIKQERP